VLLTHRKRELERLHDEQTGQLRALRAATDTCVFRLVFTFVDFLVF
jgi:hypothetical protein